MTKQIKKVEQKLILGIDPDIFNNWPLKEKLIFWDEKNLNWLHSKYPSEPKNIVSEISEKTLTIFTETESDNRIINKWRLNHFLKENPKADPFKVMEDIRKRIQENPQALKYLRLQLKIRKGQVKDALEFEMDECETIHFYFRLGFQSVVDNEDVGLNYPSQTFLYYIKYYCEGIVCAYTIPFLQMDIKRIIKGESETKKPQEWNITQPKIRWNGLQKDFAELIIELQVKGWIPPIEPNNLKSTVDKICLIFDITPTQQKVNSNPANSLYQILKGENIDGNKEYSKINTKRYKKKFSEIKKCGN